MKQKDSDLNTKEKDLIHRLVSDNNEDQDHLLGSNPQIFQDDDTLKEQLIEEINIGESILKKLK